MALSKTRIDKLGDRLKAGEATEEDLRALDEYRRSFAEAYEQVVDTVRQRFDVPVTGRPAKSTASIVEKLRRESIRLTQIQDIAGCRIIIRDHLRATIEFLKSSLEQQLSTMILEVESLKSSGRRE